MSGTKTERLILRFAPQYLGDPWFVKQVRDWTEADFLVWQDSCLFYRRLRGML